MDTTYFVLRPKIGTWFILELVTNYKHSIDELSELLEQFNLLSSELQNLKEISMTLYDFGGYQK